MDLTDEEWAVVAPHLPQPTVHNQVECQSGPIQADARLFRNLRPQR